MTSSTHASYDNDCARTDRVRSASSLCLADDRNSTRLNSSAVDRILYADKSGLLPGCSSSYNTRSCSNIDLSNSNPSTLERSILEAQIKRAASFNETMKTTIKRVRAEAQNSVEDLNKKNQSLEHALTESQSKIIELEEKLEMIKHQLGTSNDISILTSQYEKRIESLEDDKSQLQKSETANTEEILQLKQTVNELKHKLVDYENQFKLNKYDNDKLKSINECNITKLNEQAKQIEGLEKRNIELELMVSTVNSSNIVNRTLVDDIKRMNSIRFENEQLKKEIELLKLKCNERMSHDEEIRQLRKQISIANDYRMLIAKHEAEISKLRAQLADRQQN